MVDNIDETINHLDVIDSKYKNAIETQNIVELKKFIKLTSNVGYTSKVTGKNALHILSKYSSVENNFNESNDLIVWIITTKIFDVNVEDAGKWTPLHLACRYASSTSDTTTVKLLLELKADPNLFIHTGASPLVIAVNESRRSSSDDVVTLLIKYGANIEYVYNGLTPLMFACRDSHVICEDNDTSKCRSSITTVELLLKNGADPNVIVNKKTPLLLTYNSIATGNSHVETLKMLIKYGADQHMSIDGKSFYRLISDDIKEYIKPSLVEIEEYIDNEIQECYYCLDAISTIKFNCGHICVCSQCYGNVGECYKCFKKVKTFYKLKLKNS